MGLATFSQWFARARFEYRWCFLPRRCAISNKLLWMKVAVRGTQLITSTAPPVAIVKWLDPLEFLILRLKEH